MADSYHIIDGQVVPFNGGRKCNDTNAWRDATPLELQLQEQLAESKHVIVVQAAEIEALRAEVDALRAEVDALREAVVRADLQIGDGHIEAARITLHDAMDAALSPPEQPAALSKENRND